MSATLLIFTALAAALFYFLKKRNQYWSERGVPGPKPTLLTGNFGDSLLLRRSPWEIFSDIYHEYKQYPFVGIFKATTPTLLLCDPELIKDVTVKNFQHFRDNDIHVDKEIDPIFGRNPFCLKGEEWKVVRGQLTPGFTSGKMKTIFPLLEESGLQMVQFLREKEKTQEAKILSSKFTLNNVAKCAFGLDSKSFTDEEGEFQEIAKNLFQSSFFDNMLFMVSIFVPTITKLLKIKFVKKELEDRLTNIVTKTLEYREKNQIVRNDFLHILQQLKKTSEFTDVDVTAHAATFFFDGYETSAIAMSFVLYQIAANPDVQDRLREEINQDLTYDAIQTLPFLDAVVNETLRMHPPVFALLKTCTKDYTYFPKKDLITKPVTIEKGTAIAVPLAGLHYDPDFFPDPERFDPERFLETNKENIKKYTYMPFGEGPRACLGQRFAILQVKTGVARIVQAFTLSVNKKTIVPFQYDPAAFLTTPKGGLWIDFEEI